MKLVRVTTVPTTMRSFCRGLFRELQEQDGYEVVAVSSPGKELDEIALNEGVRTVAVPMERHIAPLKDLVSLWRMWRVLRREKPDMVHSMTPKAGLVTMIAAWLARVPVRIHTFTGLVFPTSTGLKRRILMATDWLTCACATHVIPEGEGVKHDLLANGITRKDIRVLGYGNIRGVDLEYWSEPQVKRFDPSQPFRFVFVGRLVGDKGINELVAAFARLNAELPGRARLTLVGRLEPELDPLSSATVRLIDECDAIDAVGLKSDVRPYYADADALVFPSYREGFPNVVIEAGAMGLPSIVTDINGSREIVVDGENGTIIPPRDEQALYAVMRRWVEHPDEPRALAVNARRMVAERFEQGYVRRCLREFYKQAGSTN